MTKSVTPAKQEKALQAVAEWLGRMGHGTVTCGCGENKTLDFVLRHVDGSDCKVIKFGPAPIGRDAAHHGLGPMLNPAWDWPSAGPTPTVLLEGGPEDWAYSVSMDEKFCAKMDKLGIYAEPYASYALCLYPA